MGGRKEGKEGGEGVRVQDHQRDRPSKDLEDEKTGEPRSDVEPLVERFADDIWVGIHRWVVKGELHHDEQRPVGDEGEENEEDRTENPSTVRNGQRGSQQTCSHQVADNVEKLVVQSSP